MLISEVTAALGLPFSHGPREVRYGNKGGLAIRHDRGEVRDWYDHSEGRGGGVDSLRRRLGLRPEPRHVAQLAPPKTAQLAQFSKAVPQPEQLDDDLAQRISKARALFRQCVPIKNTLAERYLNARGIFLDCNMADGGFHPSLLFPNLGPMPALVWLTRDTHTGRETGIHRTPLLPDGSGRAGERMMLGRAKGSAVMLDSFHDVASGLVLAEGIESALSARQLGLRPAWAALSASNLARFPVLPGIEAITIFQDNDDAGQTAARELHSRWAGAGREVTVLTPLPVGSDANDILRRLTGAVK